MIIIRRNTFETNSSSTHSLTMCTKDDYEKWKNGELVFARWSEELISSENKYLEDNEDKDYFTYDEFFDYYGEYYETFSDNYETPNGEEVIAFGYYGYN